MPNYRGRSDITEGEIKILDQLVADGAGNREIADRLNISDKTVKQHISNVMAKSRTRNRTQLALWYLRYIEGGEPLDQVKEMVQMLEPDDEQEAS